MPRPRLIRFHGVLAPHAKLRAAIVPIPAQTTTAHAVDCDHAHGAPARMSWARLLKRVFDIDVDRCVCGGKLKIIAAIEAPAVIERHAPGIVGSTAASRAGAARRYFSGGLILERGRVLATAAGRARLALAPACGLSEIGRSQGQDSRENSGACVNCHADDDACGRQ